MNRSESKFQNTANKMQGALVALLENNKFTDIKIIDICQKASVNRSTFYAHYDNTYDLLKETYESLIADFLSECNFDNPADIKNMRNSSNQELNLVSPKFLLPYLKYIQSHKKLFKIFAENAHVFNTSSMDNYIIDKLFVPTCAKYGITDKKLICYMQKYFLKGIDAIINEWIHNDCEDDILFICKIITICVRPNTDD